MHQDPKKMVSSVIAGEPAAERWISLGPGTARLPERLLLAHAQGGVLFITGAGTSMPSGLPNFKKLVVETYETIDGAVHAQVQLPRGKRTGAPGLLHKQVAEVNRFDEGDYDVVLGMLERRIDGATTAKGEVRRTISKLLATRGAPPKRPTPSALHRALVRLADRGVTTTIATTNFDRLLQQAKRGRVLTHSLGAIPRPSLHDEFAGVLHIHGVLAARSADPSEFVVTDRDFGEHYLRRRTVPDFIYDAARLFHIVLVGYSASDAPMRYLLNAVAADGSRFRDLRERFAFVPSTSPADPVLLEDWRGRGITPIPYDAANRHQQLEDTLARWSELSPINGNRKRTSALMKALVKKSRAVTPESERDLFDHLYRRSSAAERLKIAASVSAAHADLDWLLAMNNITREPMGERQL